MTNVSKLKLHRLLLWMLTNSLLKHTLKLVSLTGLATTSTESPKGVKPAATVVAKTEMCVQKFFRKYATPIEPFLEPFKY